MDDSSSGLLPFGVTHPPYRKQAPYPSYAERKKTEPEKRRMKAAGGGTTAPAKSYKDRKDIGTNTPRSKVEQQPTQQRGTAGVSGKAAQKKAYLERKRMG